MSGDGQALAGLTAVDAAAPAAGRAALPKQLGHVRHGPYPSPVRPHGVMITLFLFAKIFHV